MSKQAIILHLDKPWYNALSRQLQKEDMTVEEKLDEYLDSLIDQLPERVGGTSAGNGAVSRAMPHGSRRGCGYF